MQHSAYRFGLVAVLLGVSLSPTTNAQRPATSPMPTADEAEATTVLRALFAAAERNDMQALDSLYVGDSLTVVEGAGINRGWADYRDHHLAPEMKEMKEFHYRPADIEMRVSGNVAWAIFRFNLKAQMGARTIDNVGRGTALLPKSLSSPG